MYILNSSNLLTKSDFSHQSSCSLGEVLKTVVNLMGSWLVATTSNSEGFYLRNVVFLPHYLF
jgi:hypothetical protein